MCERVYVCVCVGCTVHLLYICLLNLQRNYKHMHSNTEGSHAPPLLPGGIVVLSVDRFMDSAHHHHSNDSSKPDKQPPKRRNPAVHQAVERSPSLWATCDLFSETSSSPGSFQDRAASAHRDHALDEVQFEEGCECRSCLLFKFTFDEQAEAWTFNAMKAMVSAFPQFSLLAQLHSTSP